MPHLFVSQKTNHFETAHSNPMMRFLRAVSTTSLVTTWSWFATSTPPHYVQRR